MNTPSMKTLKPKSKPRQPARLSALNQARDEQFGRAAYEAYCQSRGWKSVKGEPLPEWSAVKTGIKTSWIRAALAAIKAFDEAPR